MQSATLSIDPPLKEDDVNPIEELIKKYVTETENQSNDETNDTTNQEMDDEEQRASFHSVCTSGRSPSVNDELNDVVSNLNVKVIEDAKTKENSEKQDEVSSIDSEQVADTYGVDLNTNSDDRLRSQSFGGSKAKSGNTNKHSMRHSVEGGDPRGYMQTKRKDEVQSPLFEVEGTPSVKTAFTSNVESQEESFQQQVKCRSLSAKRAARKAMEEQKVTSASSKRSKFARHSTKSITEF